nr:unnamed protein product [Digitaria exilis]
MEAALIKVSEAPIDQPPDSQVKIWTREVRELSYDLEDSIDKFMVRVDGGKQPSKQSFKSFIDRSLKLLTKGKIRHNIATDIKEIRSRIKDVSKRRDRYKLDQVPSKLVERTIDNLRLSALYRKATELVGTEEKSNDLVKRLMGGDNESLSQQVIVSIVGFGGLGKTTLANLVYLKLKGKFDCAAFVYASHNPNMDKIFKNMLYQLDGHKYRNINHETWSEELLISELREFLRHKSYEKAKSAIEKFMEMNPNRPILEEDKEEENEIVRRKIRAHAHTIRAAFAFKMAGSIDVSSQFDEGLKIETRGPLMALKLIFLLCLLCIVSSAERHLVANLPGFNGTLPSQLETGYVSVDEKNGVELFYYFIQSEGDPRHDPVLLWLTGGDRCSVLSGLAFEIGPVRFIIEPYNGTLPRLQYNPYSWTKVASIIFVDSPVGAGFSFSRNLKGYDVGDVSSSLQLKEFLAKWFREHPEFLTNPFYIGGDSYAGKIVPFLAQKISEDLESGVTRPALNLKGYLVGNPATGEAIDLDSRVSYAHGHGIISDQLYETIMEHCQGEDYSKPKNVVCAEALDRSSKTYKSYLSYFWANNNVTRDALGIKMGTKHEWLRCHDGDLPYSRDIKSSIKYHYNVTSKGYRVLVYR